METLIRCLIYEKQTWLSPSYYFKNNSRRTQNEDYCVIQRTLSGSVLYQDRRQKEIIGPGELMLFCHGEDSSYGYPQESTEPYQMEYMVLSGCRDLFSSIRERNGSRFSLTPGSEAEAAYKSVLNHYQNRSFKDRFHQSQCIYALLMSLLRQTWNGSLIRDPVEAAWEHICDSYTDPISQKEIAQKAGLSREHLSRAFKNKYGMTPGTKCQELRMNKACELLRLKIYPIVQIASCCGYDSANSFSRAFKKHHELTPSQYQQQYDPET